MFTPEERERLRAELLELGRKDARVTGAAITGSLANDGEDEWSDIDLAFGVGEPAQIPNVLSEWTRQVYQANSVLHHCDVKSGAWTYRVFLFANTLQVDLAFVAADEFRALAPSFRVAFGVAKEPRHIPPPSLPDLIGLGWLYALHVRSAIARNRFWQAEYMISGMRDHALALACVSRGLPAIHGRGLHLLPKEAAEAFEGSLVRELAREELLRAFRIVTEAFLREIERVDAKLAGRLRSALLELTEIESRTRVQNSAECLTRTKK